MRHNKRAFTLVEMLVALAVSAVIVSATYASFELIKNQYKKNIDVTQLHTSGRAIMQVLEREIRMAYNIGALAYQTFVLNNPVDLGIDDFKASKEGYVMGIKMMLKDQSSNKNERYLS